MKISPYALGATLYMPSTRKDLWNIVSGEKYPELKSVVICLEDALAEQDVALGLQNLLVLLQQLADNQRRVTAPLVFVRPRDVIMMAKLSEWKHIHQLDGVVLPKVDMSTVQNWMKAVPDSMLLMPTLETVQVFDGVAMTELRHFFDIHTQNILALRIGGNDLLASLGLRRPKDYTLYQTPLAGVIHQLICTFSPLRYSLTAPVYEYFAQTSLLEQEVAFDVQNGLVGKTIIHPSQIATVHHAFKVSLIDYEAAMAILAPEAPAVFQYNGAMLEKATHLAWATKIYQRAHHYGRESV